jgi:dTDP-4-amino-4,6-dideoxygalactose transaminase
MKNKIPFLRPNLVRKEALSPYLAEIEATRVYSNFGPLNTRFEKQVLDQYFNQLGAVTTVSNATIGLVLALSQSKRPKGKYVLMPSFTFAATPLAAIWGGLEPFFVDISSDDWCMDEKILSEWIVTLGDQVAAVLPYATFGTNMNLEFYRKLHESGVPVVVDAAPGFGVFENENHFGKGFPGSVVFRFPAPKSFGVGEGGLIYSADEELISRIQQAENFGFSTSRETALQGLNGKISEYTAAVALATLDVFDEKIKTRQQIYSWYLEQLNEKFLFEKGWIVQKADGIIPHQFMPICCPEGKHNDDIIRSLASQEIEARTYFSPPCHRHSYFSKYPHTSLPVTENISNRILSLPLWEEMTKEEVCTIVAGIEQS